MSEVLRSKLAGLRRSARHLGPSDVPAVCFRLQGNLAYKETPAPRTLP